MIVQFYEGKSILLTGATGFLGKVVFEKILRTFPNVKRVYLSMRVKSGQEADEAAKLDEAYNRYKKEIKGSQIFDALKIELGRKGLRKLLRKKVKLLPMDLAQENLGLSPSLIQELRSELNIIINCAGSQGFDARLDVATNVNVGGVLKLLILANECQHFEVFT